jgi:ribosome-associated protein
MDIRKLQRAIVDGLEDVKGQDILVLNTEHLSPLFERVIIASGTSNRQTKALASGVREAVKAAGFPVLATEGGDNGEWIIVDCGAAVVHVMQPSIREYYHLEEIWGGKPVKMKLGNDKPKGLVKASEPDDEDDEAPAPAKKRAAAKKAAPAKAAPARKAVAAKPTPSSPEAAAKRAASKAGPAKVAAAKKAAAKKVAAKKVPARKTAAPAPKVQTIVVKPQRKVEASGKAAAAGRAGAGKAAPARKTAAGGKAAPARKTAPKRG